MGKGKKNGGNEQYTGKGSKQAPNPKGSNNEKECK